MPRFTMTIDLDGEAAEVIWRDGMLTGDPWVLDAVQAFAETGATVGATATGPFFPAGFDTVEVALATITAGCHELGWRVIAYGGDRPPPYPLAEGALS